jgi:hypothetical protein
VRGDEVDADPSHRPLPRQPDADRTPRLGQRAGVLWQCREPAADEGLPRLAAEDLLMRRELADAAVGA